MAPKSKNVDVEKGEDKKDVPHWHAMSAEDAAGVLGIGKGFQKSGLSESEAKARLEEYGLNQLTAKESKTLLQRIWNLVNNVLVGILTFIAIVSTVKGSLATNTGERITNFIEVGLICFVIIINTCIGLYQEGSAEQAAEALKSMLSSDAIVIREGKQTSIPANELVPGDVVCLNTGDRVPADIRVIEINHLACQEAALTGESVPIEKSVDTIVCSGDPEAVPLGDRKNMCFSATLVAAGAGVGLVVSTGDNTEIGTINKLVSDQGEKRTEVLKQIDFVSKVLAVFIIITAIVIWCVAFFVAGSSPIDAMSYALVCAVAMIPAGLEAIATMTYSWSTAKMAEVNAIIRRLPAVETLGSVTVICSDKTGTLTKNEMSLVAFVTSNAHYKNDVDNKNPTWKNFVRDDSYLAERAAGAKNLSASAIIRKGASASRSDGRANFGFSMHGASYHSTGSLDADEMLDDDEDMPEDPTPVPNGTSPEQAFTRSALAGGVLCSKCVLGKGGGKDGEIGNPTELAILRASFFAQVNVAEMKDAAPIVAEVPFSSEYKFMATVHEAQPENDGKFPEDQYVVHVKGAPDRMIKLCSDQYKAGVVGEENKEAMNMAYWTEQIAILSSHGLRVIALCRGSVSRDSVSKGDQLKPEFVNGRAEPWLTLVGLCAIMDPPRPECVDAIKVAHRAGVRVAMITGDHKDTALAIGDQLGLVDDKYSEAITGPDLDAMSDAELRTAVQKYNIFARASPNNKIQIVKALQAEGEICSMTGDGVNDAPALKAANMGVAMGKEGTDVAREASEMILADDNFATIVAAVKEGRTVWDNLRKAIFINTPINNAQGMSVLFGLAFGMEYSPLTPVQVLYCNLICATTLGFVAAVEPGEEGIMDRPPRRLGKRLIGRFLLLKIIIGTIVMVAVTVGSIFWARTFGNNYTMAEERSLALNTLSFGALSITLSARFSYASSINPRVLKGNALVWWSCLLMLVLQVLITYTPGLNSIVFSMAPMDGPQWGIVAVFTVVVLIVMEGEKAIRRYLSALGADTDDREFDSRFDEQVVASDEPFPRTHLRDELHR